MKLSICKLIVMMGVFLAVVVVNAFSVYEVSFFDFEKDLQGWGIPEWAFQRNEYVADNIALCREVSVKGDSSLKLMVEFSGHDWLAAITEVEGEFDLTRYRKLTCDIFIPETAPGGLEGRIILTSSRNWTWAEMSLPVYLRPGKWVTVSGILRTGNFYWRGSNDRVKKITDEFKSEIKKLGIRVESDSVRYKGPIYIDNVKLIA